MRAGKAQATLKLHINDYNLPNQLVRKDQRLLGSGLDPESEQKFHEELNYRRNKEQSRHVHFQQPQIQSRTPYRKDIKVDF